MANGYGNNSESFHAAMRPPAVDADPQARPGVPLYGQSDLIPPPLAQQVATAEVLVAPERGELTPVFSNAVPPRGLSGVIRRLAYKIPEHKAPRWLLLVLGDRIDVWEHRVQRHPVLSAAVVVGLIGLGGFGLARRRR
jgi:hypothetical protein